MEKDPNNKERVYNTASVLLSIFMTLSLLLLMGYLIAPFIGGKFFLNAVIKYATWVGMALVLKYGLSRLRKDQRIGLAQYLLVSAYSVLCMFIWFKYPLNIASSILIVIGTVISYKANKAKQQKQEP